MLLIINKITRYFGLSVKTIIQWNGMRQGKRVYKGRKIEGKPKIGGYRGRKETRSHK